MSWHPVESVDDSDNPELELSRACDGWSLQFCRDKVYHKLEEAKFLLRTRWVCCQKPGRRQALSQLLLQGSTSEKTTMKCLESPLWPHSLRLRRPEPKCLFALVSHRRRASATWSLLLLRQILAPKSAWVTSEGIQRACCRMAPRQEVSSR